MKALDLTMQRFGRLVAIAPFIDLEPVRRIRWLCLCDCGNYSLTIVTNLRKGTTKSCGCLRNDYARTHGLTYHPLYAVWNGVKSRCTRPSNIGYHLYGGRGIQMCSEWLNDSATFIRWGIDNGYAPGLQIERRDNNRLERGYSPENCYWATVTQQGRNKRTNRIIEFGGKKLTVAEWFEQPEVISLGVSKNGFLARFDYGWTTEEVFTTPVRFDWRKIKWKGRTMTVRECSREAGISYTTFRNRLVSGWSLSDAFNTKPQRSWRQGASV